MKKRSLSAILCLLLVMSQYQPVMAAETGDGLVDFGQYVQEEIAEQQQQQEEQSVNTPITEVKLSHSSLTLLKSDTYCLTVTGTTNKINWSSSDEKVASVNDKGKITAIGIGSARVSATVDEKTYSCKLTVKKQLSDNKSFVVKNLKYTITKEATASTAGTVSVGANNKNIKTVSVPQTIKYKSKTYKITAISDNGFINCSKLTTIKMDEYKLEQTPNLKVIGTNAFVGCEKLQKVLIDIRKVTTIKAYAFYNCTSLKQVGAIIDGLATTWDAFKERPYEKYSTRFDNLKEIQKYTFFNCANMEICYFNEKINVNEYAFYNCNKITDIDKPGIVGDYAFYNCDNVTTVTYYYPEKGVEKMYDYGMIFEAGTIGEFAYANCDGIKEILLQDDVNIKDYAFYNCNNMEVIYYGAVSLFDININYEAVFYEAPINTIMFDGEEDFYYQTSLYKYAVDNMWQIKYNYPFIYIG